jgi:hypothetical protein
VEVNEETSPKTKVRVCGELNIIPAQKKPSTPKKHPSAARPSWSFKTRRFPSSPQGGFGFIGIN